jgi:hypothetical protein
MVAFPARLQAAGGKGYWQLSAGAGPVRGNCEFSNELGSEVCLSGSCDLPNGACRGGNCGGGGSGGGGSNDACAVVGVAIVAIAVTALILYGIWFALFSIFADKVKFGLAYSNDFQTAGIANFRDWYEAYRVQRFGLQTGLYLVPDVDLQLHATTSYSKARIDRRVIKESGVDEQSDTYHLEGFSSALGLGWVPSARDSGPFVYVEVESNFFDANTVRRYLEEKQKKPAPLSRQSAALIGGYAF